MSVGTSPSYGNSNLFAGALGVVKIGWNGYDLGKTTADTEITVDEDIKDIVAQQMGTKAYDQYRTGELLMLEAVLTEVDTGLLARVLDTRVKSGFGSVDNGAFVPAMQNSLRDNEAHVLKIAPIVGGLNQISALEKDEMYFYEAQIKINGALINWGVDSQRALPVQFIIYPHDVSEDSDTYDWAYGYWGDPDTNDLPAADWSDAGNMDVSSIHIMSATECYIQFQDDIDTLGDADAFMVYDGENGVFYQPISVAIDTEEDDKAVYTFDAATFEEGNYEYTGFVAPGAADNADGDTNRAVSGQLVYNDI